MPTVTTMPTASTSPTSNNTARNKHPTSTPIIESAHHLLDGSLHLLQHTLSDAGAANRFYPAGLASPKLQESGSKYINAWPERKIISAKTSRLSVQHPSGQSASPATSSFTCSDSAYGSTRSTRVASVNTKKTTNVAAHVHKSRIMHGSTSKRNTVNSSKKGGDQVGKAKVFIGDKAHSIWNHIMGSSDSSNKRGKRVKKRVLQSKGKDWRDDWIGLGLPPAASNKSVDAEQQSHTSLLKNETKVQTEMMKSKNREQAKSSRSTSSASFSVFNSPSIPLYPLLILLFFYHLTRRIFSYQNRTRVSRKLQGIWGSKKFSVSQEELARHIDILARKNRKGRVAGESITTINGKTNIGVDGNGDVAGGCVPVISATLFGKLSSDNLSEKSSKGSDGSLSSTLMKSISESLNLLKDEKEELIHQRRLLLHDRDMHYDDKSEKKLILQLLTEKVEECQKTVKANQKLKETLKAVRLEFSDANDTAQNLADKLAQTKREKEKLKASLDEKKLLHDDVTATVTKLQAKVEKLTNDNIILNNVIGRLEEENAEMEKVIDEACQSDNRDLDIEEIDVAIVSSSLVEDAESLTQDDEDDDDIVKLQLEKESLQNQVKDLQQLLSTKQSELDTMAKETRILPQAREDTLSEMKIDELQHLLEDKQSDLDRLTTENQAVASKLSNADQLLTRTQLQLDKLTSENQGLNSQLSRLQLEHEDIKGRQISSLQQARVSHLESKLEELQKVLKRTQLELEKKSRGNETMTTILSQAQNERDLLKEQLVAIQESTERANHEGIDKPATPEVEELQNKNNQLTKSLADLETLYTSLCAEKHNMEKSIEITSTRFKSILTEKETLESTLRKERKRIKWCNKALQDASNSASILIFELQFEMKQANGTVSSPDSAHSPISKQSDGSVSSKTLMHHAEALQQQLLALKNTNQQLITAFKELIPDTEESKNSETTKIKADEIVSSPNKSTAHHDENHENFPENALNQSIESTGSESSGELKLLQQMLDNAKSSGKVDGDIKRLVSSLENEIQAKKSKSKREKSRSPTNTSPNLHRALSVRRLWRKKSAP